MEENQEVNVDSGQQQSTEIKFDGEQSLVLSILKKKFFQVKDFILTSFYQDPGKSEVEKFLKQEQIRLFERNYAKPASIFIMIMTVVFTVLFYHHWSHLDEDREYNSRMATFFLLVNLTYLPTLFLLSYNVKLCMMIYPYQIGGLATLIFDICVQPSERFEIHPYVPLVICYYFVSIAAFPSEAITFLFNFVASWMYYYYRCSCEYTDPPDEYFIMIILAIIYFSMGTTMTKNSFMNLYSEILNNRKLISGMKKVLEFFPHGVLIQNEDVGTKKCFTNHEFSEQIKDIRNNLNHLDSVKVSFERQRSLNAGNEVTMTLLQYLEECRRKLDAREVHENHQVVIKSNPGSLGQILDNGQDDPEHEMKYFNIKSMKVDWQGQPSVMHVFNNTTHSQKLEEARNNIRCQKIMFASASHEFRTPLNSIINSYDFIMDLYLDISRLVKQNEHKYDRKTRDRLRRNHESMTKFVRMGKSSSIFLLALVEDVLNLSKIEAGTFETKIENFKLNDILDEVQDLFQYQCKQKGIKISFSISSQLDGVTLESDKTRIKQILMNLLSNSFKFTFKGWIKVIAEMVQHEERDFAQVRVIDTGIGIREEDQKKLFTLFSQLSDRTLNPNGTGIGLTICKKYLEKIGGHISAQSRYGEGTCMTFAFPFVPRPNKFASVRQLLSQEIDLSSRSIGSEMSEMKDLNVEEFLKMRLTPKQPIFQSTPK